VRPEQGDPRSPARKCPWGTLLADIPVHSAAPPRSGDAAFLLGARVSPSVGRPGRPADRSTVVPAEDPAKERDLRRFPVASRPETSKRAPGGSAAGGRPDANSTERDALPEWRSRQAVTRRACPTRSLPERLPGRPHSDVEGRSPEIFFGAPESFGLKAPRIATHIFFALRESKRDRPRGQRAVRTVTAAYDRQRPTALPHTPTLPLAHTLRRTIAPGPVGPTSFDRNRRPTLPHALSPILRGSGTIFGFSLSRVASPTHASPEPCLSSRPFAVSCASCSSVFSSGPPQRSPRSRRR